MVKKTFFVTFTAFFLTLASTVFLFGGQFSASVDNADINLNENVILSLTVEDASPRGAPDISHLKNDFTIASQQHSTSTTIINGKASSTITWKLSLSPQREGAIKIPPITIETDQGALSTEEITLNVSRASEEKSDQESNGLNFVSYVNSPSPYKNEPFIYTGLLTSKVPLYNVQLQKVQMENAIVEFVNEPKLEERIIDGIRLYVVEFKYLITPLKPGPLTISPSAILGSIPQRRNDQVPFFSMMQGMERFTLMTDEIQLSVEPPIPEISPWLPAKSLSLEEHCSIDEELRVGVPFSRDLLIKGEGLKLSQLPSLEQIQSENGSFKVYADKAEENESVVSETIHSSRKEHFTLIPQKAGLLEIPEIKINWWDTTKKEKRTSTIPLRRVEVLPPLETASSPDSSPLEGGEAPPSPRSISPLFLGITAALLVFLAAALFWGITLQRKIAILKGESPQKKRKPRAVLAKRKKSTPRAAPRKEKKEKLPGLNPT